MNPLKETYEDYMAKKLNSECMLDLCMLSPDDEGLDAMSDKAYRDECDALEDFAAEMEKFTNGQVDAMTAKKMACNPVWLPVRVTLLQNHRPPYVVVGQFGYQSG